jgi:hypothetical protein
MSSNRGGKDPSVWRVLKHTTLRKVSPRIEREAMSSNRGGKDPSVWRVLKHTTLRKVSPRIEREAMSSNRGGKDPCVWKGPGHTSSRDQLFHQVHNNISSSPPPLLLSSLQSFRRPRDQGSTEPSSPVRPGSIITLREWRWKHLDQPTEPCKQSRVDPSLFSIAHD